MGPGLAILMIAGGLALLAGGGEVLIRGAVSLARLAGLTTAVIGLTVVAFGTSLPELTVSLLAAARHQPDIAVGNVIGSNIFNIALTLGIASLVRPMEVHGTAVKVDWPVMLVVTAAGVIVMRDLVIDRVEGGFLMLGLIAFTSFSVWLARREVKDAEAQELEAEVAMLTPPREWRALGVSLALVVGGIAALVLGARLLVEGSVVVAQLAGVSERVIGLTIVAAGTSLPELAASITAARRGHSDIAIANLLGSNVFNILGILGVTAAILPIQVSPEIMRTDVWWMLGTALALFPLMRTGRRISRLEGGLMVTVYVVYLALLI